MVKVMEELSPLFLCGVGRLEVEARWKEEDEQRTRELVRSSGRVSSLLLLALGYYLSYGKRILLRTYLCVTCTCS